MKDTSTTQCDLFLVIPEQEHLAEVRSRLSDVYAVSGFSDIDTMQALAIEKNPKLILCHQSLFEEDKNNKLTDLARRCPDSRIMIIGPPRPMAIQIAALKQGARGYFNNELPLSKLHDALEVILHGEVWVERHVIAGLIDELTHSPGISEQQEQALETLSPKELEVAKLVSHGATNKMIAREMDITERTVKAHLTNIFQKMGLPDRLSLAIFFRDLR
ncbi:LuxR C-terminal-related transcriptional regulator [Methylophaga sp.]|uniref:response regulator transcription factor n=1 Tax=Methylophaga sp. TaxID=2024840 RepID=UPI003F6A10AD